MDTGKEKDIKKQPENKAQKPKISLRDQILAANDIKTELVTVPEWGNVVIKVKGMTGKERATLLSGCMRKDGTIDLEKAYPQIIISCAFDQETGEKIFTPADREILNTKSGSAMERVAQVAMKLSGLDEKSTNEMRKNF